MATHSSVLAWRIPGTVKPDGLPSMGLHRVGHDWSDLAAAAAAVISDVEHLFMSYWPSVCPFWRSIHLGLLPNFWLGYLFFCYWIVWTVCVLEIKLLLVTILSDIFSLSEGCLSVSCVVSFAMQKIISLIRSHLLSFAFFYCLGDWLKKTLV